jgi:serine/threonine-protein kinase RsbW
MEIRHSLSLPRDEISVPVVRHLSREALSLLGVNEDCISDIELAITEACTNVLKHARTQHEQYDVEVEIGDELCSIRVIDAGEGFDHEAAKAMQQSLSAEGGRGIQLMSALVDDLTFTSVPEEGTVVHLEKKLVLEKDALLTRLRSKVLPA